MPSQEPPTTVEDWARKYRQGIIDRGVAIGSVAITPLMISDYPARRVSYITYSEDGAHWILLTWNFFIIENRFLMSLTYAAPVEKFDEYRPIFENMASSFRVNPEVLSKGYFSRPTR